jgi:pyruvate/2-oxoacid:ferredoxin oxidoreductase beta subunit
MQINEEEVTPGTLEFGEIHPSAHDAFKFIRKALAERSNNGFLLLESLSSCAISGNRLAEVCAETLRRVLHKEPVSDRYILGLAWMLRDMQEAESSQKPRTPKKIARKQTVKTMRKANKPRITKKKPTKKAKK